MWEKIVSFFMAIYTFFCTLFGITIKNDTAKITLEGNPTTGYDWVCVVEDATIAACIDEQYKESSGVGAGGIFTFTFQGLKEGVTTATLTYERAVEPTLEKPTRVYLLTVDAELKISVKEIKAGSEATVTLPGTDSAGHFWTYTIDDAAIAVLTGFMVYPNLNGNEDTPYNLAYTFTAQAAGSTVITFTSSLSFLDPEAGITYRYLVTVDSALNIEIEKL